MAGEIEPTSFEPNEASEPSIELVERLGVSSGKEGIRDDKPLVHVLMLNVSEQPKYVHARAVLGRLEEAETVEKN